MNGVEIAAAFDSAEPLSVGIEEELMLLDPESGDLAPLADEVLERVDGDRRFKRELPAAQLEIRTDPARSVGEAIAELADARRKLDEATAGLVRLAAAGVHPFAAAEGILNPGGRYEHTAREYAGFARRQLVFALQVHVAPGSAKRALAVYNALRSLLPELAALAANAPFYEGIDTGLASVRPKISEQLPRQGVPPPLADWEEYAGELAWGARAGSIPVARSWWWELRPHPEFGTLELRVPDAQTTVEEAAAVAAFAHCLVARLGELHDAGELHSAAPSWRIAENRWWAARDGVEGALADLSTGERIPTRERLGALLDDLAPHAERLGCANELEGARALVAENGALRQRAMVAERGLDALVPWLAERWLAGVERS
jgi:glutamate---cysteine ligase / carboxylate-amine ligase